MQSKELKLYLCSGLQCSKLKCWRQDVPPKGSCKDVLCPTEHLIRSSWGKAGYPSCSSGIQWTPRLAQISAEPKPLHPAGETGRGGAEKNLCPSPGPLPCLQQSHCAQLWAGRRRLTLLLPSSHLTLQQPHLPGHCAYSCSALPDNKHPGSTRGTERIVQGNHLLFMHNLKYILFNCTSLPALFRELLIVYGFSLILCTR